MSEIRRHRQQRGLTQCALAEKAGVSESSIYLLERGFKAERSTTLEAVAKVFGVPVDQLLSDA